MQCNLWEGAHPYTCTYAKSCAHTLRHKHKHAQAHTSQCTPGTLVPAPQKNRQPRPAEIDKTYRARRSTSDWWLRFDVPFQNNFVLHRKKKEKERKAYYWLFTRFFAPPRPALRIFTPVRPALQENTQPRTSLKQTHTHTDWWTHTHTHTLHIKPEIKLRVLSSG